jgi:hypothetical protein
LPMKRNHSAPVPPKMPCRRISGIVALASEDRLSKSRRWSTRCSVFAHLVLSFSKMNSPSASASVMSYSRHLRTLIERALTPKAGDFVHSRPFVFPVADRPKRRPFSQVRFPRVVA